MLNNSEPRADELKVIANLINSKKFLEAVDYAEKSIKVFPNSINLLKMLTNANIFLNNFDKAIETYSKLSTIDPLDKNYYKTLGALYVKKGDLDSAIASYTEALELNCCDAEIYYNLGNTYYKKRAFDYSIANYRNAIEINKNYFDALYNLANTLSELKNFFSAIDFFKRAYEVNPQHPGLLSNLGIAYFETAQFEEAVYMFEIAFKKTHHPAIGEYLGRALLTLGNFCKGWRHYEYRLKIHNKVSPHINNDDRAVWSGEKGKSLLFLREQGIGDEILFLGLAPEAQKMCSSLTVLIDKRLKTLFERSMPDIRFISDFKNGTQVDYQYKISTGSLPKLFRNSEKDFVNTLERYLKADPKKIRHMLRKFDFSGKKVVGISWASFDCNNSSKKTIDLKKMIDVFEGLDVVILNLQYGKVNSEIESIERNNGIKIFNSSYVNNKNDLEGLAALIEICDLVITIPNATIHLSGALGKETWGILPYSPNYLWLNSGSESLWYPSIKLYRQEKFNDWSSPLSKIKEELRNRFNKD